MTGTEPLGNAAQEAARLFDALGEWLAARADGTGPGGPRAQWCGEHIATGSAECLLCPVCRLIALARSATPEVAEHLDGVLKAVAATLRAAADAMGSTGTSDGRAGKPFETIVIN